MWGQVNWEWIFVLEFSPVFPLMHWNLYFWQERIQKVQIFQHVHFLEVILSLGRSSTKIYPKVYSKWNEKCI